MEEIDNQEQLNQNTQKTGKQFLKNTTIVLISNIISIISGILVGFIIPKIMGVSEYGYYKTFTLYSSYIGLLHFGFVDGIYLKFAGKSFEELEKERFRTYTRFLFGIEFAVLLIVISISLFFLNTNYFFLILLIGLNIFATNVITYYEFLSQITMRFKRTTIRNIIRCVLNTLSIVTLYLLYHFGVIQTVYSYIYIVIVLSISYILAIWYIVSYKDITFGKGTTLKEEKDNILFFFKVGVPLLLSNLVAQLLFVVDQQFVNVVFDNDTYSLYAFAYNLISLITVATSAVSTVLYPTLKRINTNTITDNYSKLNSYLMIAVALCLFSYYPFVFVIKYFLPKYSDSLQAFKIILPGLLLSSSISVIKYNCYKVFGLVNNYFFKSLIVLILAIGADLLVYFIFKNTSTISMVSIVVLFLWYILAEEYFVRHYKAKWVKNGLYAIIVIAMFYGISFINPMYIGMIVYLFSYIAVTLIMYLKELRELLLSFKRKRA